MEKNMMVLEIMKIYDENERLRNSVEWLSRTQEKPLTDLQRNLLKYANERIFKEVVWVYDGSLEYEFVGDGFDFMPFNEWLERVIQYRNLPSWMSYDEFVEYFKHELIWLFEDEQYKAKEKEMLKHGTPSED